VPRSADSAVPASVKTTASGTGSGARRRLSGTKRRDQIITSARSVFVEQGLAGTRTRDLAEAAGVNEALIYQHFGSKRELFDEAVIRPLDDAVAGLVERAGTPPDDFDVSSALMRSATRTFISELLQVMDGISPLLGAALFGGSGSPSEYYEQRLLPIITQIEDVIRANLGSWMHRDFDPRLTVRMTFGTAWIYSLESRATGTDIDRDKLAEDMTTLFFDGLLPRQDRDQTP